MKSAILCMVVLMTVCVAQAELVLYYDFEGDSGTTVTDKSGMGFDGTLEAGYPGSSAELPSYVTSHDGSTAMQFGYDSGVAGSGWNDITVGTAYNATLANVGQGWSMAFWARQDLNTGEWTGQYGRVISCANYEIELGASGDPASYFWPYNADPGYGDPTSWDMGMAANPYQDWFHMAVTYDGTTFTQYINGTAVFSNGQVVPFVEDTWLNDFDYSALRIGAQCGGFDKSYFVGLLDDVAIWGNAYLEADAVAGLYNGTYTALTAPTIVVPEPATLALLAIGGVLLRKRK